MGVDLRPGDRAQQKRIRAAARRELARKRSRAKDRARDVPQTSEERRQVAEQMSDDRKRERREKREQEFRQRRHRFLLRQQRQVQAGKIPPSLATRRIQQAGFAPAGASFKAPKGVPGFAAKFVGNIAEAGVYAPAGLYEAGKAVKRDVGDATRGDFDFERSRELGKQVGKAMWEDIRHPMRKPGYTFLTGFGLATAGAGTTTRVASASGQLRRGAGVRKAATGKSYEGGSLLHRPLPGVRTQRLEGLEVRDRYALNPAMRGVQKVYDRLPLDKTRRVGKLLAQERRIVDAAQRAPADALRRAGRHMTGGQRMALRVVHEEAPLETVIARHKGWAREATGQRRRDLTHKVGLLEAARRYIDDSGDKPVLTGFDRPSRFKGRRGVSASALRGISARIDRVAGGEPGGRERVLRELGWLDDESAAFRKSAPGRIMHGAEFVPERRGRRGQTYIDLQGKTLPARTETRQRERTVAEAERKAEQLEEFIGRRVDVATKAMLGDPAMRRRTVSKDQRQRREYRGAEPFQIGRHGPESAEPVDKDFKPLRFQEGRQATREAAEKRIYDLGKKEGAHPVLKQIADAMDELVELRGGLLQRREGALADPGESRRSLGTVDEITSVRVPARFGEEIGRKDRGRLEGAEDFTGGRTRIPDTPLVQRPAARRPAIFRGGVPRKPGSVTKGYTGGLRRSGNYRTDTERLVAESAVEAQRSASVERLRARVIEGGVKEKPENTRYRQFVPVREKRLTRKESRRLSMMIGRVEHGADNLTSEERLAAAHALKEFTDDAFPAIGQFAHVPAGEKVNGVVWVPKRLVDGVNLDAQIALLGPAFRYFDTAQNVVKASILFAKPTAYVSANAAGNAVFNIAHQGILAPRNWYLAARLGRDVDVAAGADEVMGGGFMRSITEGTGTGSLSGFIHSVGNALGALSDLVFRRAAFVHEARRYGFKSNADIKRLLYDRDKHELLTEVAGRARSAIVDYERLSPFERTAVRRAFFVWPWVKGATLYAGHFVSEHPIQAAALAQLAKEGKEQADKDLGPMPSYARGVFKVGGTGRRPTIVNPSGIFPFSTPAQLGRTIATAVTGKGGRADMPFELISPLIGATVETAQGRSSFTGGPVEPGIGGLLKNLAEGSAPGVLRQQLTRARESEEQQAERAFPATEGQATGRFAFGTWFPRDANPKVLNEQAASEGDDGNPAAREFRKVFDERRIFHQEVRRLVPEGLEDGRLPKPIRQAFNRKASRYAAYRAIGPKPTQRERLEADLRLFTRWGYVTKAQADEVRRIAARPDVTDDHVAELRTTWSTRKDGMWRKAYLDTIGGKSPAAKVLKERGANLDGD